MYSFAVFYEKIDGKSELLPFPEVFMEIYPIARIFTDFPAKFGIPRQSGIISNKSIIVFEKKFRSDDAIRGIDGYSHLWLIWEFTEAKQQSVRLTVRPPRLGGNTRVGVFATRSPFRPNSLGLSCVRLSEVRHGTPDGTVLIVEGADILSGTPIYDIKPYLPFTDSRPDALGGFGENIRSGITQVHFACDIPAGLNGEKLETLKSILLEDPRPHYQNDNERVYAFEFADRRIKFTVKCGTVTVTEITDL